MPKYKDYQEYDRPVKVSLCNGDILTLRYSPAKYSAGLSERTMPAGEKKGISDEEFLSEILIGWDWLDEKGKPMPITRPFLKEGVHIADRAEIVRAVYADVFPNSETVTNSSSVSASPDTDGDSGLS